ncbi:MAG: alpha/beta hydrolase [Gemmatimonadota bacterium]
MGRAVLHEGSFTAGPLAVEYRAIAPGGWEGPASLPLLLVLHGADSSAAILDEQLELYDGLWSAGTFPDVVVACASTPTVGGFYIDWPAAPWETAVAEDFPRHLGERFGADLDRIMLLGSSMGGYGALKIAFTDPGRFTAVAAMQPAVFPGEAMADVGPRNTLGVLRELHAAMAGGAGDKDAYDREHVVARLRRNAAAVRGLPILIECGDNDSFNLHDGAEYLHRVLWDLDVSHDYRLVRGADHVGSSRVPRERSAREFLAAALAARDRPDPQPPEAFRAWLAGGGAGAMPPVDFYSPEGAAALRLMLEPERQAAAAQDPGASRRYGSLGA